MRTDTKILIQAMHHLANDIQSEDGVANAAISEAGYRLEELQSINAELLNALCNLLCFVERCREAGILDCDDIGEESMAADAIESAKSKGEQP